MPFDLALLNRRRRIALSGSTSWVALLADGTSYSVPRTARTADNTLYTVPQAVLTANGTSYNPI